MIDRGYRQIATGVHGQRARGWPRLAATLMMAGAALLLGGCLEGDGAASPAASAAATAPSTGQQNQAPTISGTAPATATVGAAYSFTPAATDANGDSLAFTISNKPAWAVFDTLTGRLSGTPTLADIGTYANIRISVTDGSTTAQLGTFSVTVNQTGTGTATLSWMPPTQNTDGSQLTNLSGYRIYFGTSSGSLNQSILIGNAGISTYVVENLYPATWYFAVKAIAAGVESDLSNVASKTIS